MKIKKSNITTIETLSAYLDGQLPEVEVHELRQQLSEDAVLRAQLDDLRQARYVLSKTPRLKRRRSFVLSPEMVRKQKTFLRAMNVSRAVSAFASVLLVVALGSQYLFSGGMGYSALSAADMAEGENVQLAEAPAAEEPMMMEAAEEMDSLDVPAEEESAPMAAVAEEPAEEPAEEAADAPSTAPVEEEPAADDVQGTSEPSGGGGLPPTPTIETIQELGAANTTLTPEGEMRSMEIQKDGGDVSQEDEAAPPMEELLPTQILIPEQVPEPSRQITLLHIAQGILLLLAISGALTAAFFRKKVR